MLEAKYYRDYGHNYMILQCRQQDAVRSYQYKILTSGKIGEILRCSVRYINGSTYYYYDISSKTTLDSLYRDKKMSYTQIRDFLCQIHGIYEKLAGYFMEETGLVLLPEHIYYDLTDKKYIGLYYPDYQTKELDSYRPLIDFLLEHMDTEDRNLTDKMYRIYEMAEENCFFIEDALHILESGGESVQEGQQEPLREMPQESMREEDRKWSADSMESFNVLGNFSERDEYEKISPRKNLFYPVFAGLSVLGIAGAATVVNIYQLTQREEIILYGSIAAMGVCLIFCLARTLAGNKGKTMPESNFDKGVDQGVGRENYATNINFPSLENVINRDMNLEMTGYTHESVRQTPAGNKLPGAVGTAQEDNDFGNTVFFDESTVKEYKLYAMDKRNKKHIELNQFPYTIGKMAGCVDCVLPDDSVSRIHARFDKQGDKVMLTDMNSTNGTFKNGLRMQPQETVEIEPGDEVRFGNLNYCYR